jgi:hypothetical protein
VKLVGDMVQSVYLTRIFDFKVDAGAIDSSGIIAGILASHQCRRIMHNDGIYVHVEARVRGSGGSIVCRWNLPISRPRQRE